MFKYRKHGLFMQYEAPGKCLATSCVTACWSLCLWGREFQRRSVRKCVRVSLRRLGFTVTWSRLQRSEMSTPNEDATIAVAQNTLQTASKGSYTTYHNRPSILPPVHPSDHCGPVPPILSVVFVVMRYESLVRETTHVPKYFSIIK